MLSKNVLAFAVGLN